MKVSKKLVLSATYGYDHFVLVACGNSGPNPSNQAAQSQARSSVSQSSDSVIKQQGKQQYKQQPKYRSSEASASSQTAASDLDGAYKATHEGDALNPRSFWK